MLRYQIRKVADPAEERRARGGYDRLVGWLPSGSSTRKQDAIDRCASKPYAGFVTDTRTNDIVFIHSPAADDLRRSLLEGK
jgi:hypothetical protein